MGDLRVLYAAHRAVNQPLFTEASVPVLRRLTASAQGMPTLSQPTWFGTPEIREAAFLILDALDQQANGARDDAFLQLDQLYDRALALAPSDPTVLVLAMQRDNLLDRKPELAAKIARLRAVNPPPDHAKCAQFYAEANGIATKP